VIVNVPDLPNAVTPLQKRIKTILRLVAMTKPQPLPKMEAAVVMLPPMIMAMPLVPAVRLMKSNFMSGISIMPRMNRVFVKNSLSSELSLMSFCPSNVEPIVLVASGSSHSQPVTLLKRLSLRWIRLN